MMHLLIDKQFLSFIKDWYVKMQALNEKKNFSNLQVAATSVFSIVCVETNCQSRVEKMYNYNIFYEWQTFLLNKKSPKTANLWENKFHFFLYCL